MASVTLFIKIKVRQLVKALRGLAVYKFYLRVKWSVAKFFLAFSFYFYNSFITHFPSYKVRIFYLRRIIKIKIGNRTSIHMGCFFAGSNIEIGNNNVIGRNCNFDGRAGLIKIGNNVSIAPEVVILSMSHQIDSPVFDIDIKPVYIEDYVWIATRAILMPGITLGKGSVVGAGSVVTKTVLEYNIVAGSPAKKIRERNRSTDLRYELNYFPLFNSDI
jgi:acetyltransferase-like isoleucine patch superfamily enzyme